MLSVVDNPFFPVFYERSINVVNLPQLDIIDSQTNVFNLKVSDLGVTNNTHIIQQQLSSNLFCGSNGGNSIITVQFINLNKISLEFSDCLDGFSLARRNHRGNTIPHGLRKVNGKRKKITSFTISPTLLDGWRYVPCEPTTNRTWTPGTTGVLSIYTNKLGVYVLSCYLNISRGT
jgi:hypothetical protein